MSTSNNEMFLIHAYICFYLFCTSQEFSVKKGKMNNKIVHGRRTTIDNYPYMVTLQKREYYTYWDTFCGGTIISKRWVLSAAHCVCDNNNASNACEMDQRDLRIVAGNSWVTIPSNMTEKQFMVRYVEKYIAHNFSVFIDGRNYTYWKNDVVVILLKKSLVFKNRVGRVRLAPPEMFRKISPLKLFHSCRILGWGLRKFEGQPTRMLNYVDVPLIDTNECGELDQAYLDDYYVCTLDRGGRYGPCMGDSGGPLMCGGLQIAIFSATEGCADHNHPSIFTRVDKYFDWIWTVTKMGNRPKNPYADKGPIIRGQTFLILFLLVLSLEFINQ